MDSMLLESVASTLLGFLDFVRLARKYETLVQLVDSALLKSVVLAFSGSLDVVLRESSGSVPK